MNLLASDVLLAAASLAYIAASALFLGCMMGRKERLSASRVAAHFMIAGAVLHAAHILVASVVWNICPMRGVHFSLSIVALITSALFLIMRRHYRLDLLGAFIAPLALTFLLASRFVGSVGLEPLPRIQNAMLPVHVFANVVGEAMFMLASGVAVAYLMQERRLKEKRVAGVIQRLPPLDWLDRAGHRLLLAGFPMLTIGIVTGTVWARHVEAGTAADVARAVFGYTSWLLFAAVLFLRAAWGWRGRRAAYGTIAGFGFALLVLLIYLLRGESPPAALAYQRLP